MINKNEKEEKLFLDMVIDELQTSYDEIDRKVKDYAKDIVETKQYIWENIAGLDNAEKAAKY
ncbi:MAG: uvrD [Anaerocolumna sp.]|nr:uvrD [Anaerocolumna sp.]